MLKSHKYGGLSSQVLISAILLLIYVSASFWGRKDFWGSNKKPRVRAFLKRSGLVLPHVLMNPSFYRE
jgi:hypothetical protein